MCKKEIQEEGRKGERERVKERKREKEKKVQSLQINDTLIYD